MQIGIKGFTANLSSVRSVKESYINIVYVLTGNSPSVEEYEAKGGTYPKFVLSKITEIEAKEASSESQSPTT